MKTKLKQSKAQARLEIRHGALCVLVETPFSAGRSGAAAPGMRQWYRVAEPPLDPALVARRPVRSIDPSEGLFVDEEGNSYRLAGGGEATPEYAEVIPAVNGQATQHRAGASVNGRHRCKGEEKGGASDPLPEPPEMNLREKFAEVRQRLGYIQKRGHNERHHYSYVMAADLAGAVGDILSELGVVVIPQLQSISTETPRSSNERIARIVMNYRFVDARSGEELTVRVAGEGADTGDKAPYKAMTGALKYALLQSFLLASGDDPEDERGDMRGNPGPERPITPEQVRELEALIDETGTELERVLAYYKVSALSEMTEGSYRRALEVLNRKLAKRNQENRVHAQN
jgi:hypothetical protein